jgi:hypothetical protein
MGGAVLVPPLSASDAAVTLALRVLLETSTTEVAGDCSTSTSLPFLLT